MKVYMYQAALYCEACGDKIKATTKEAPDSDNYPQGPYPDGGGEADTPRHCDDCGCFLENPLTNDGYDYVQVALEQPILEHEALSKWMEYYDFRIVHPD